MNILNLISRKRLVFFILTAGLLIAVTLPVRAQLFRKKMLYSLLKKNPEYFKTILANPAKYRIQIIYTQINRDARNQPHFKTYNYRLNPNEYFYPASTVKLPGALLALEKLNKLRVAHLNKDTPLRIDSAYAKQTAVTVDSTAPDNVPTLAHYIKKIFLVSDNDAYNRLYEFLGQEQLNAGLHQKGYSNVRLLHRLSVGDAGETTRYTNPTAFYRGDQIIYQQPLVYNSRSYPSKIKEIRLGAGYYNASNHLVKQPMDFSDRNYISLETLHRILISVIFPEVVPEQQRFNLSPDDYDFVLKYMSMKPGESNYPKYDTTTYYDTYAKFFLFGNQHKSMPPHMRVFNKIGNAYGFMIDNAYVVDFANKVEFLLSAVVLGNEDDIFNDDKYEYNTVCYPFLINLGQVIYQHELKRFKKHLPNLSRFTFNY